MTKPILARLVILAALAASTALVRAEPAPRPVAGNKTPSIVRIEKTDTGWRLLRDGEPYFILGAVVGESGSLDLLKDAGANSIRTHAGMLDEAQRCGFSALVRLPLGNPRHGFDYANAARVKRQFKEARAIVRKHRHHPALLLWNLGNEPEIFTTREQRVPLLKEANRMAEMVKREDPNHPVMMVIGGEYAEMLHEVNELCPALDLIGLNSYAQMLTLPEDVAREGWTRPYVITEFGPRGHWQVPKTDWRVPIEDNAEEKAAFYERAYRHAVEGQPSCLGSYVFYWAHKQEKTHTWYGMFLPDGSRTPAIDMMTRLWTGRWPANRCPTLGTPALRVTHADGRSMERFGTFRAGETLEAQVTVHDRDGDALRVSWDLRPDVADNPNVGGDWEPSVEPIPGVITAAHPDSPRAQVTLPGAGKYRLFVYVHDGQGNATTANMPLLIE